MSVERVGISKKSENHIQKKSTPFLWTSFQGIGKSPPRVGFPPHFTAPQGGGISARGEGIPPLHHIKNFHMTTKTITTPVTVTITVTIWICF